MTGPKELRPEIRALLNGLPAKALPDYSEDPYVAQRVGAVIVKATKNSDGKAKNSK